MLRSTTLLTLAAFTLATGCFFSIADVEQAPDVTNGAGGSAVSAGAPSGVGALDSGGAGAATRLETIELASDQLAPWGLAQDEDDLYWTAADGIHRCAKSGDPAWLRKVADGANLHDLVVDASWVYFADGQNSRISKVEKKGGFSQAVISVDGPFALATDGSALFYGSAAGSVFSVQKDGSGVRQLYQGAASAPEDVYDLVVAGDYVVFGDTEARGVFAVAKDGSAQAVKLAKTAASVFGVAVMGPDVFFREGGATNGILATAPLAGGEQQDLLLDQPGAGAVVAAMGQLFFANDIPSRAAIRQLSAEKNMTQVLVDDRSSIGALQVDVTAVYWTEPDSGKVMKAVR